jgi:hypothetical protein
MEATIHDRERYRSNATDCLSEAHDTLQPDHRNLNLFMATKWLSLARQDGATENLIASWNTPNAPEPRMASFIFQGVLGCFRQLFLAPQMLRAFLPGRLSPEPARSHQQPMRLEKGAIIGILHDEPAFSEMFVAHLLARTIRVEEDLVDQLFNSSEKRLARALLLLANFGKEGKPEPIIANVSQETLAEMIGTTRSRVSHFMNKFRRLGFIDYNGALEVHSSLLSVVLHDQPHIKKRT